jgi:hypothetical protein
MDIQTILEKEEKRIKDYCIANGFTMHEIYTKDGGPHNDTHKCYALAQINLLRSIKMQLNGE